MKDNQFTCAKCHQTFYKGWSDEDAEKEYNEVFPDSIDEVDVVCDDCYKEMITVRPPRKGVNYE